MNERNHVEPFNNRGPESHAWPLGVLAGIASKRNGVDFTAISDNGSILPLQMVGNFMRFSVLLVGFTVFLILAGPQAALADDVATCINARGDERIAACTRAIKSSRWRGVDLAWAYTNRGSGYDDKEDYDHAIADHSEAIRLNPKKSIYYVNRGRAYSQKDDKDRAIADYSEAIRLDPTNRYGRMNLGLAYDAKGDVDKAIAAFIDVTKVAPDWYSGYKNLALEYDAKGDRDGAIAAITEAIRLEPDWADYLNRGIFYISKDDFDHGIADLNEVIRLKPEEARAYYNRGIAYEGKHDTDQAIADYSEAIRRDPKYLNAYRDRANIYRSRGDYSRALADYGEAISVDPKDSRFYFKRGLVYVLVGSVAKAQSDFKQMSELAPQNGYAALWHDLTERRNNISSHLAEAAKQLDMTKWPAPVVSLFLGQTTSAAVLDAAQNPDATKQKAQVCEANFYSGELALVQGAKDEATRLLKLAASDCPADIDEREAAVAELKTLGVAP